jgi:uncharacterized protein YvpB
VSEQPRGIYTRASRRRRSRLPLLLAAVAAVALAAGVRALVTDSEPPPEPEVRLTLDGRSVLRARAADVTRWDAAALRRRLGQLPDRRRTRRGTVVVELRLDRRATVDRLRAMASRGGGTLPVVERPVASTNSIPVVKQRLRNNCESAALAMLLRAAGRPADQLTLQRELPRSGPLDPVSRSDGSLVWGDPRAGYVGRPEGGGTAGGYGVYQGPVRALARRRGVELADLTRQPPSRVYDALLRGRPVMVWIGLSDGPYRTWRTPDGARVTGNFGEHTVVLTGLRGDVLAVNDPLSGRRLRWSRPEFELMWRRLGDRALAL